MIAIFTTTLSHFYCDRAELKKYTIDLYVNGDLVGAIFYNDVGEIYVSGKLIYENK